MDKEPTSTATNPLRVLLLSPPLNSLTHPYSSLPALTAFLRTRGQRVSQCDLGMAAIDATFTRDGIEALIQTIRSRRQKLSTVTEHDPLRIELSNALLFADEVASKIELAKEALRSESSFYDPCRYLWAHRIVARALDLISAAYHPIRFEGEIFTMGQPPTFDNLAAFANDPTRNPFERPMRKILSGVIATERPEIVGISVTYSYQLFFAYALARMIRDLLPDTMIVLGGAAIHLAEDALRRYPDRAFDWADCYVFGAGEGPLANLLDLLQNPHECKGFHTNLYLNPAGNIRRSIPDSMVTIDPPIDLDALPTPDYEGLDMVIYLAPEILFLLGNSRNCYYGKCAFCSCSYGHRGTYQVRALPKVQEDLRLLIEKFGARHLFFTDDCIPPKRCAEIADFLLASDFCLSWSGELRFENAFTHGLIAQMADSGFCYASFGNESGSRQVLESMRKGTDPKHNAHLLGLMAEAGIGIDLQNFIGFPGESHDQAIETVRFLLAGKGAISTCALGTFRVTHGSPVALQPESFGVQHLELIDPESLMPAYRYKVNRGIKPEDLPAFGKQFAGFLGMNFPANSFFLDGSVGSHNLLYHARFGADWIRTHLGRFLFPPVGWQGDGDLKLEEGVRWVHHGEGQIGFFNPTNGIFLQLEEGEQCLALLRAGGDVQLWLETASVGPTERKKLMHDLAWLQRQGMISAVGDR